jgi:proteasome lid subunit RPN8/RPN11
MSQLGEIPSLRTAPGQWSGPEGIDKGKNMSGFGIRLAPPEVLQPEVSAQPLEDVQRWNTPYDCDPVELSVLVFMEQAAYIRVSVHANSDSVEVGGVLVGQWCLDEADGRQFLVIRHALPARHTRQGNVYMTFTQDSLVDLHDQIEKRFEGERIVGWYHTHPRMGIFLSPFDTWLHNNFFPEPWQVALVVEPFTSLGGFFIRQADGNLDPTRYFGFSEIGGSLGRSIVRWQNLWQVEKGSEGECPDE